MYINQVWILFYGVRMYDFFRYPDDRSTVTVTAGRQTSADPYKQNKNAIKTGSTEMPSYVNELYKQRGFESTTQLQALNSTERGFGSGNLGVPKENRKYEKSTSGSGRSNSNYKAAKQNGDDDDDEQGIEESDNLIHSR